MRLKEQQWLWLDFQTMWDNSIKFCILLKCPRLSFHVDVWKLSVRTEYEFVRPLCLATCGVVYQTSTLTESQNFTPGLYLQNLNLILRIFLFQHFFDHHLVYYWSISIQHIFWSYMEVFNQHIFRSFSF